MPPDGDERLRQGPTCFGALERQEGGLSQHQVESRHGLVAGRGALCISGQGRNCRQTGRGRSCAGELRQPLEERRSQRGPLKRAAPGQPTLIAPPWRRIAGVDLQPHSQIGREQSGEVIVGSRRQGLESRQTSGRPIAAGQCHDLSKGRLDALRGARFRVLCGPAKKGHGFIATLAVTIASGKRQGKMQTGEALGPWLEVDRGVANQSDRLVSASGPESDVGRQLRGERRGDASEDLRSSSLAFERGRIGGPSSSPGSSLGRGGGGGRVRLLDGAAGPLEFVTAGPTEEGDEVGTAEGESNEEEIFSKVESGAGPSLLAVRGAKGPTSILDPSVDGRGIVPGVPRWCRGERPSRGCGRDGTRRRLGSARSRTVDEDHEEHRRGEAAGGDGAAIVVGSAEGFDHGRAWKITLV